MTEPKNPSPRVPAYRFASTRDWPGYFSVVAGKGARETTLFALDRFAAEGVPLEGVAPPLAVDLGCGEGRDTAAMVERGWRVVAIDGHETAFEYLGRRGLLGHPMVDARQSEFEHCSVPRCRLVNSSFSLPFCHPDSFDALWRVIRAAIEPGGRFAGQFFGDRDDWASLPDRSHHTRLGVEQMLLGMEVEMLGEEEKESVDSEGHDKHWHVFHVVARQPD